MKKSIHIVILLLVFLFGNVVTAVGQTLPAAKKMAVYGVDFYVSKSVYNYKAKAKEITLGATGKYEKTKALYLWLCENISYDTSNTYRTADECWDHRRAVCQGYCELFYRMAETVGVKSRLVFGKCKDGVHGTDLEEHTWLSVKTERGTILLDPTWGAGQMVQGRFFRMSDPLLWFDIDPYWMIFTHYPDSKRNQHLDKPITLEQFTALPYMTPLTAPDVSPREVFETMMTGEKE